MAAFSPISPCFITNPDGETNLGIGNNIVACHMCFEQLIRNGNADFSLDSVDRSTRCMGNLWQPLLRFSDHLLYHFCKKEDGGKVFHIFRGFLAQRMSLRGKYCRCKLRKWHVFAAFREKSTFFLCGCFGLLRDNAEAMLRLY